MALWKVLVYQRTLSCPVVQILSRSLLYITFFIVIIGNVGFSHAVPASEYILDSKPGIFGGGGTNVESGNRVIHSVETTVVSFGILISLVVFAVLCTGGCCLNIFGKRRGDDIPTAGFSNPVADLGSSATIISPIDVRALEMNPIVFEPLPTIHDLTPVSTNFYNSLHRGVDSSSRHSRHLSPDSQTGTYPGIGATVAVVPTDESSVYAHDWFDEPYRNFPRGHIEYVKEVGKGWFGKLIEAEAEDIVPFTKKLRVLVKVLREDATGTEQMRFLDESRLYRDANHGNILKLLGHSIETLPFLLIMEHCPQGDLKSFLIANVARAELLNTQGALVRMALDIAKGLEWMASADFIHSDLAARNCQVGSEGRVIIGDYGMATQTFRDDYYWGRHESSVAIPLRWSAPETLHCTINTIQILKVLKSSNVWTFGVVLWEICEFGKLPYYDMNDDEVISRVITDKTATLSKLTRPGLFMKDELYKIMLSCCNPSPEFRPVMSTVVEQLEALFNTMHINLATSFSPVSNLSNTPIAVSGLKQVKDDFDKKWDEFGTKLNTPRSPEVALSPSWEGSTNGSETTSVGLNKKKTVSFVEMQHDELPSVQVKVGTSVSVQQSELPITFKNLAAREAVESINSSISQSYNKDKSLINMSSASEPPRSISSSGLLPHSNGKEEMDVWKVNGDNEEENWRQRIELGEISQKVQEKSQSVQDLMVLTHVEPSELSDSDSLVIVAQGQSRKPAPQVRNSLSNDVSQLGIEANSVSSSNKVSVQNSNSKAALNSSSSSQATDGNCSISFSESASKSDSPTKSKEGAENHVSTATKSGGPKSVLMSSLVTVSNDSNLSRRTVSDLSKGDIDFNSVSVEQSGSTSERTEKNGHGLYNLGSTNTTAVSKTLPTIGKTSAADLIIGTVNHSNSETSTSEGHFNVYQGDGKSLESKSHVMTSDLNNLVLETTLNQAVSISNRTDISSDSGTCVRAGSSVLPSKSNAKLNFASSEVNSSYNTSQSKQNETYNSNNNNNTVQAQPSLSQLYTFDNQTNVSKTISTLHTDDSTKTLTSLDIGEKSIADVISPAADNLITNSSSNGNAKTISRDDGTEINLEKVLPAEVRNPKVNFILSEKNSATPEKKSEGTAKLNKILPRLRMTSTPNNSPGLSDSFTDDSDFFQRTDDIFDDFSMELSTQLSPIKKAQHFPPSMITSNASIDYNNFHVVLGASEDLGLMPYQRVTTQIEREMGYPAGEIYSDDSESTNHDGSENYDPSLLSKTGTNTANNFGARTSDMWLCTEDSQQQQGQMRSKSGFNDIFGAGRPHTDTPVFQGTYTPEIESGESESQTPKNGVARKLFLSDSSLLDKQGTNSTSKIEKLQSSPELFSSKPVQNHKNLDTWDTFNSHHASTSPNLSSSNEQESEGEKCVTVLKKPTADSSAYEKQRVTDDESFTAPSYQAETEFKLGLNIGNDPIESVEITGENSGKDKFVEDIENAVEEFGSLVLADLEEEDSKVEVIKETREDEMFSGKGMDSSIIRVAKRAFSDISDTTVDPGSTISTDADTLNTSYTVGTVDEQSEVSVLTSDVSEFIKDAEGNNALPDFDESDIGDEDDNDDESICREFVPSKWNQNLAPVKPAIKSPEQQKIRETSESTPSGNTSLSGLKKSVSFERIRKKTQLVYEYPPPPPASDSDDEEKHGKAIGTGGGHLSLALDWELQPEELENTDVHQDDWEDEFTQSRTDNPMDMYRFSGFENFQVRPSAEPFEFQRITAAPTSSSEPLGLSTPSLTNFFLPSSVGSAGFAASTLGELRHTRGRLKLDLTKGEASLLDSERVVGDTTKLATSKPQHVDSGVGSSTNVSPFTQCDNNN